MLTDWINSWQCNFSDWMNRWRSNKSVFLSLLVPGPLTVVLIALIGEKSQEDWMAILAGSASGIGLGTVIALFERARQRRKPDQPYRPSNLPYRVNTGFLLIAFIGSVFDDSPTSVFLESKPVGLSLLTAFGFYYLTLAFAFRLYEVRTGRNRITWHELTGRPASG